MLRLASILPDEHELSLFIGAAFGQRKNDRRLRTPDDCLRQRTRPIGPTPLLERRFDLVYAQGMQDGLVHLRSGVVWLSPNVVEGRFDAPGLRRQFERR